MGVNMGFFSRPEIFCISGRCLWLFARPYKRGLYSSGARSGDSISAIIFLPPPL